MVEGPTHSKSEPFKLTFVYALARTVTSTKVNIEMASAMARARSPSWMGHTRCANTELGVGVVGTIETLMSRKTSSEATRLKVHI